MVRLICLMTLLSTGQLCSQIFELPKHFTTVRQGFALSLNENKSTYLNVGIEYYDNKYWSIKSQSNLLLASKSNSGYEFDNLTGINGHFLVNNIDFFAGVQPGVQFSKHKEINKTEIAPLIGLSAGINYYSTRYFHLFTEFNFITSNNAREGLTSNYRISFGLGYNLSQIYNVLKN